MKRQEQVKLNNQYSESDALRYSARALFSCLDFKRLKKSTFCRLAEALIVGIKFSDMFLFTKADLSP